MDSTFTAATSGQRRGAMNTRRRRVTGTSRRRGAEIDKYVDVSAPSRLRVLVTTTARARRGAEAEIDKYVDVSAPSRVPVDVMQPGEHLL